MESGVDDAARVIKKPKLTITPHHQLPINDRINRLREQKGIEPKLTGEDKERFRILLLPNLKEQELLTSDIISEQSLSGVVPDVHSIINDPTFVALKSGSAGIFKRASEEKWAGNFIEEGTYYLRERAAFLVSKMMGFDFVPTTVIRDVNREIGSLQEFIPDSKTGWEIHNDHQKTGTQVMEQNELFKLWVFDYVIWSTDRNNLRNLLFKDNKVLAIDNGLAFTHDTLRVAKDFSDYVAPDDIKELFKGFAEDKLKQSALRHQLLPLLPNNEVEMVFARIHHMNTLFQSKGLVPKGEAVYNP